MDFNKEQLENIYQGIKNKRKQQDEHIKIVQEIDKEVEKEILEYRIESVKRVLSYLHTNLFLKKEVDYGTLITHCCNKLSGNIDGIELQLNKEE